jgi:hypothetical protein
MVALTYPKKFIVERTGGGSAPMGISTGSGWFESVPVRGNASPLMKLLHALRLRL